ncbi:putative DNA mismatch repair protein Mlh3 isoform X13 [Penaeus vannamei]|uniref:Putative DNA mismatch repair protein Mlh3 isoform X13 n=1 Tax=Penaeus vannamei TaxID=6689 RepID=A0A3R7Q3H7_PENVA|nr:putative DNA mismatch repair protein Mlh3 isoform X13 [Penaeus vannamei]
MSGKILPLSESVRSKLRSGITITSIAQCVEEMVLNSIDANATCIAVRIDPAIFRIQVVDNGDGVTEENLKLLGKRHSTSKCHSLEDLNSNLGHYGFRGEALASLVEVAAIVDITTRPRGSVQTLTKIFAYGKEKSISVSKVPRPSVGTTITVQDFMYNMPVRRKLMKEAIDIENIRTLVEFRDWDKLLLCIEEMVIKFAEEERLAISLDERYRRSGRDQVMAEEESQAEPHSSQALLQEMPEWTSSQPQGAPVLKIPLSEEPEAEGSRQKQDFVLTHGYSAFMSWKKRREMQKKEMEKSEIKISGCAYDSRDTQQDQYRQEAVSKEGEECESLISPGMKEAIQSILQDSEMDDDSIKWSEKPSNLGSLEEDSSEVAQICQEWEPPTFAMDADILSSKVQAGSERGVNKDSSVKIYNIVHPYKFSQEMLQTCRVLGQLDKKFIACEITYTSSDPTLHKVSEIIVLFDQHAVHERVRLETLTEENYETLENGERVIRTCMITPPLEMTLPESEVRLMMAYAKTFILWGLHFTQVSASQVNFQSIPSILVARERHELRQRRCQSATAIIESIVRDVCYTLHQTGGIVSTMPKPLMNVLCSQACRGAIKFGDELSYDECKNLVKSLSSCALPFQCAHGRPSIVPVVNLTHLAKGRKKERKPNLHKLREAIEEEMLGEEIMD